MTTTKYKISVMEGFDDGKKIQIMSRTENIWIDYNLIEHPIWNWEDNDYRIKSEKKKRLMTNKELFYKMATHIRPPEGDFVYTIVNFPTFDKGEIYYGNYYNSTAFYETIEELQEKGFHWTSDREYWHDFEVEV